MDRVALKDQAKKMIQGNKWYLWKPLVLLMIAIFIIIIIFSLFLELISADNNTLMICIGIISFIIGLFSTAFSVGYSHYCLSFVRGTKMEFKDVLDYTKNHLWISIGVSILVGILAMLGSILFVIPGIIIAVGLTFYQEVIVDNNNLSCVEVIKKAWELTKGHKMDIFVLQLSFIGWLILAEFTLGILNIWLMPYMTITLTLAYEELRKAA